LLFDVGHPALDDAGKILVLLRDGRKLMGTLRSFDQFGILHFMIVLVVG